MNDREPPFIVKDPNFQARIKWGPNSYLGGGSFGIVYKCQLLVENGDYVDAAVKEIILKPSKHKKICEKEIRESIEIWRELHHERILQFLDVAYECNVEGTEGKIYVFSELAKGGTIKDVIDSELPKKGLQLKLLLTWMTQICEGFRFLHTQPCPIIHRDVKPDNILLDNDSNILIGDFDFIKAIHRMDLNVSSGGAFFYTAPELFNYNQDRPNANYITHADIYSVGLVFGEMVLCTQVLLGHHRHMANNSTFQKPNKCPKDIWALIKKCIAKDPEERPSAKLIMKGISEIKTKMADDLERFVWDIAKQEEEEDEENNYDQENTTPTVANNLIENASGGLLLRGILNGQPLQPLIMLRKNIQLCGPIGSVLERIDEFQDESSEQELHKKIKTYGLGKYEDPKSKSHNTGSGQRYYSKVHYTAVPICSCIINEFDVMIRPIALNDLEDIDRMLGSKNQEHALSLCNRFIETYGSHIILGNISFGGLFMHSVYSRKINKGNELKFRNKASLMIEGPKDNVDLRSLEQNTDDNDEIVMNTAIKRFGGSKNAETVKEWKRNLSDTDLKKKSLKLAVIYRDVENKMALWEIICKQNAECFKNPKQLAELLHACCQDTTKNQEPFSNLLEVDICIRKCKHLSTECIPQWKMARNYKKVALQRIILVRTEVEMIIKDEFSFWAKQFLSQESVQDYLQQVSTNYFDSEEKKALMRKIATPQDASHLNSMQFEAMKEVYEWSKEQSKEHTTVGKTTFKKIEDVLTAVQKAVDTIVTFPEESQRVKKLDIETRRVSSYVNRFCKTLAQRPEDVSFRCLVYRFGYSFLNGRFSKGSFDIDMFKKFKQNLEDEVSLISELKSLSVVTQCEAKVLLRFLQPQYDPFSTELREQDFITEEIVGQLQSMEVKAILYSYDVNDMEERRTVIKELGAMKGKKFSEIKVTSLSSHYEWKHSVIERKQQGKTNTINPCLENMNSRIGFNSFYPRKLTCDDIFRTTDSIHDHPKPKSDLELGMYFLKQLQMFNHEVHKQVIVEERGGKRSTGSATSRFKRNKKTTERSKSTIEYLNPIDIEVASFLSCDPFAQQEFIRRLWQCKLAVPLVVQEVTDVPTFFYWPLQDLVMTWKPRGECLIVDEPTTCFSFIRFGKLEKSKSFIINEIFRNKHPTFFHRYLLESTIAEKVLEGFVDIAWILPNGSEQGEFKQPIMIANLHGDARRCRQQTELLIFSSAIVTIFCKSNELSNNSEGFNKVIEVARNSFALIILLDDKISEENGKVVEHIVKILDEQGLEKKYEILTLDDSELVELVFNIRVNLNELDLPGHERKFSLKEMSKLAEKLGFIVDTEFNQYKQGIVHAETVLKEVLKHRAAGERKYDILSLQGKFWEAWCSVDRELRKMANKSNVTKLTDKLENRKLLHRRLQFNKIRKGELSEGMNIFLGVLLHESKEVKGFFLKYLKILLDDLSRKELAGCKVNYGIQRLRYTEARDVTKRKKVQLEIEILNNEMADLSIGLEHFLRELGQIYEASVSQKEKDYQDISKSLQRLPCIAVELLMYGYPLEMMDGKTGVIPTTWIAAVFDELNNVTRRQNIENVNVIVLSVIGIQSSGKSTLLNTMFGLQFAVSAGRCSNGVYFQLIKTSGEFRRESGIQYALVIDTEGLRSPEKNSDVSQLRDNELVTFVTGISNITLINVMGENIVILDEILPISVLAFLRMKITKNTQPRCLLIHQNVLTIAEGDLQQQSTALERRLDEHTESACRFQNTEVLQFRDVITFDTSSDTSYIRALLDGEHPMAYISTGYSTGVDMLKRRALQETQVCRNQTIIQVKQNILSLSKAIIGDDFVYNFRNILEIQARGKLDEYWCELSWDFRYKIKKLQSSCNVKIMNCNDLEAINDQEHKLLHNNDIVILSKEYESQLNSFFQSCDENLRTYIENWKDNSLTKLQELTSHLKNLLKAEVKTFANTRKMQLDIEENVKEYESTIMGDIAKMVRNKEDERTKDTRKVSESQLEMRSIFEERWIHWVDEIFKKHEFVEPDFSTIERDAEEALRLHFPKHGTLITDKILKKRISDYVISDFYITEEHYDAAWLNKALLLDYDPPIKRLEQLAQTTYKTVADMLEENDIKDNPYNSVVYDTILGVIKNATIHKTHFTFQFYIDLSFIACGNAIRKLHDFSKRFNERNNPRFRIEQNKENYFSIFLLRFKKIEVEITLARAIVDMIFRGIEQQLDNDLPGRIANDMKIHSHFNVFSSKTAFIKDMLQEYIQLNDYQKFSFYLNFPVLAIKEQVKSKVSGWALGYECNKEKGNDFLTDVITQLIQLSIDGLNSAYRSIQVTTDVNFKTYLNLLQTNTKDHLILGNADKALEIAEEISEDNEKIDFELMINEILVSLKEEKRITDIKNRYLECGGISQRLQYGIIEKVASFLKDNVIGCTECCPFCGEICKSGMPDHIGLSHTTPLHRPKGICGFRDPDSSKLIVETCTRGMAGDTKFRNADTNGELKNFRDYREVNARYASWDIPCDTSLEAAKYWKWFMTEYNKILAQKWNANAGDIPPEWKSIDRVMALKQLNTDLYF